MPYITKTLITSEACDASPDKRLSICLLADGFSFAQLSSDGELLAFGEASGQHEEGMPELTRDIKEYFTSVHVHPLSFSDMRLIVSSNENVWVPDEIYQPEYNHQYLQFVGGKSESLFTSHSEVVSATAVFGASEVLATSFKVVLPGLSVTNQHVCMAELASQFTRGTVMLSHWRDGRVDLSIYNEGRYLFGNTLAFSEESAVLFNFVELMKSYGLESDETTLLMCGDVSRERYARLRPYFPKVALWSGNATLEGQFSSFRAYRHALLLV